MRPNRRTSLYQRFNPGVVPPEETDDTALWFLFQGSKMVLFRSGKQLRVPDKRFLLEIGQGVTGQHYLGELDRRACFCAQLHAALDTVEDVELLSLRSAFTGLDDALFALAGRAFQIIEWDRTHQFCGRCGTRTVDEIGERAKRCPGCDLVSYPTLAPAVIVAVRRGNALLLARSPRFPEGMHSVLAGFVEPGETLEEAVEREVREEAGIRVCNIRYFGSQPWPFPNSLMIGFTAEYAGGTLRIDEDELEQADWYGIERLPPLPGEISIARRLIDAFVADVRNDGIAG